MLLLYLDLEIQTRKPVRHRKSQGGPDHPSPVQSQRELRRGHHRGRSNPCLVQLRQWKLDSHLCSIQTDLSSINLTHFYITGIKCKVKCDTILKELAIKMYKHLLLLLFLKK